MQRKYKLVIVDDDPVIVRSLSVVLDWESLGFEVAATASNGEEGAALSCLHQADLVITDIRMPVMDGLQLLARVKEKLPSVVVIMLSGYGEFKHAREALRYGALDYLLKPVDHEELERVVKEARAVLDESNTMLLERVRLNHSLQGVSELVRERLLCSILEGTDKPYDRLYWLEDWEFEHSYTMLLVLLDDMVQMNSWSPRERKLWNFSVGNVLAECTEQHQCITRFPFRSGEWVVLLQAVVPEEASRIAERAAELVRKHTKLSCSVGISRSFLGVDTLHDSYRSARNALCPRFTGGSGVYMDCGVEEGAVSGTEAAGLLQRLDHWEGRLVEAIAQQQRSQVRHALDELAEELRAVRVQQKEVTVWMIHLAVGIFRRLSEQFRPFDDFSGLIEQIPACVTLEEMTDLLGKSISRYLDKLATQGSEGMDKGAIHKAILYADKRFHQDISVDEVAEFAGLSSSHFCVLFKRQTGVTFLEYLTKKRIERACAILRNSDTRVHQIAPLVGYQDPKYFTQVFKKLVGMTPTEYRQESGAADQSS